MAFATSRDCWCVGLGSSCVRAILDPVPKMSRPGGLDPNENTCPSSVRMKVWRLAGDADDLLAAELLVEALARLGLVGRVTVIVRATEAQLAPRALAPHEVVGRPLHELKVEILARALPPALHLLLDDVIFYFETLLLRALFPATTLYSRLRRGAHFLFVLVLLWVVVWGLRLGMDSLVCPLL